MAESDPEFAKTLGHFELHDNTKRAFTPLSKAFSLLTYCRQQEAYRAEQVHLLALRRRTWRRVSADHQVHLRCD